jgi:hypothetical protein
MKLPTINTDIWSGFKRVFSKRKKTTGLTGFKSRAPIAGVDFLEQKYLNELNEILPWQCFTVDDHGRAFGAPSSDVKRAKPQPIPDKRIADLNRKFNLREKTVLEVGCFEGVHTLGLCKYAKTVKAVDSRIENLVKTMVRVGFYQKSAQVFFCDLEKISASDIDRLKCDVLHHVGVLYHLSNPVEHLIQAAQFTSEAIFLDTHIASPGMLDSEYKTSLGVFRYHRYNEHGYKDAFSGMKDHAKWLSLEDLRKILTQVSFKSIEVIEERLERNGPRVTLLAKKN